MADKELVVFKKGFADWEVTHPARWIATTDKGEAANFISEQTNKITKTQLEAANGIIISQELIREEVAKVAVNTERIAKGVEGLASAFEWGFSEIIWHLEQEREVLENILKVLQSPLNTQAKELKKRAEEAYRNGWIDDASKDFLESEKKNRYDFTVHQSLGNIYLFHKKDPQKALSYYEKAKKYATPKSSYYASLALLHIGLVRYFQEDFRRAYEATLEAIKLSPELPEAHYQCAQYCAKLGKQEEAIEHLDKAIEKDRNFCLKADSEKDFDTMKDRLQSFFKAKRDEAYRQAKEWIDIAQSWISWAEQIAEEHRIANSKFNEEIKYTKANQDKAKRLLKRASFFDSLDAAYTAFSTYYRLLNFLKGQLSHRISEYEEKYNDCFNITLFIIAGAVIAILALIVVVGSSFSEGKIAEAIWFLVTSIIVVPIEAAILGGMFWLLAIPLKILARKKIKHKISAVHDEIGEINTSLNTG